MTRLSMPYFLIISWNPKPLLMTPILPTMLEGVANILDPVQANQYPPEAATSLSSTNYIQVMPQGTIDNNIGPDHLAGPKALDPNYCRQPTL